MLYQIFKLNLHGAQSDNMSEVVRHSIYKR